MIESIKEKRQNLTVPEVVIRLKEIQQSLLVLFANLHENIKALDDDPDFQDRLQSLQRDTERRANSLEEEVKHLRSDVKNIKDLLGDIVEKKTP